MASCQCCLCDVDTYLHPEKCPIKRKQNKYLTDKYAIHHKDGDPYNNDLNNLETISIRSFSENRR
jgi:hypothetical protein